MAKNGQKMAKTNFFLKIWKYGLHGLYEPYFVKYGWKFGPGEHFEVYILKNREIWIFHKISSKMNKNVEIKAKNGFKCLGYIYRLDL